MVNTFITSNDAVTCARNLDDRRLNKQATECMQLVDALEKGTGYKNHTATKMWVGYVPALKYYTNVMIREWIGRGKNNTRPYYNVHQNEIVWPWWWNWTDLHLTHKCSLLRKDPEYYSKIFHLQDREKRYMEIGYLWPSEVTDYLIPRYNIQNMNQLISVLQSLDSYNLCSPIGQGAPANYRWSREQVEKWIANPTVNPKTNRKISSTSKSGAYPDLVKAAKIYGYVI